MDDLFGVGVSEVNCCDQGLDVQEHLAFAPLATAALPVQPIIGIASKKQLSQALCSGGAIFRLRRFNDTQPTADLQMYLLS